MPAQEWDDSFGALLARFRRAAGLTQEQLADRAELSVRAISSLECGSRHPRRLTLDRLAAALDLTSAQRTGLQGAARYGRRRAVPVGTLLPIAGPAGPLVGRRTELAELHAHLTGDGPAVLTYDGEAGIGKSRLLAEAVALGTRIGMPVLVGVGRRDSGPYSPLADALADHVRRTPPSVLAAQLRGCAGLELLLPELADRTRPGWPGPASTMQSATGAGASTERGGPSTDGGGVEPGRQGRRLMFEAAGRFLDNIAGTGNLLLVLDDLHWAGPDTAELLAYLVRRSWRYLRLIAACRTGDVGPGTPLGQCAADLARLHLVRGRRLAPLTPPESDALISVTDGEAALSETVRTRIVRLSGGLPLFLVELTRAALDAPPDPAASTLPASGATTRSGAQRVPWHLRLAVVHQLSVLPEPVVLLLRRMAVAGPTVTVAQLVGDERDAELVLDRLDVARRYRILDETRYGFRFRYPLVREVLAVGMGPNRRRLWRSGSADVRHAPVRTA
jgi:transcriptional regulator with XRE-family HTH domain